MIEKRLVHGTRRIIVTPDDCDRTILDGQGILFHRTPRRSSQVLTSAPNDFTVSEIIVANVFIGSEMTEPLSAERAQPASPPMANRRQAGLLAGAEFRQDAGCGREVGSQHRAREIKTPDMCGIAQHRGAQQVSGVLNPHPSTLASSCRA